MTNTKDGGQCPPYIMLIRLEFGYGVDLPTCVGNDDTLGIVANERDKDPVR